MTVICTICGCDFNSQDCHHSLYDLRGREIEILQSKLILMQAERDGYASELHNVVEYERGIQAKLDIAVDLLKRLNEWDMLWLGIGQPSLVADGPYWKQEIKKALKKLEIENPPPDGGITSKTEEK